jgi:hypothetical protein
MTLYSFKWMNQKLGLKFLVLNALFTALLVAAVPNAEAAKPSDYYCREMPAINPVMYDGGEKTCTDAAGSKTVSVGKTCIENVQCFYLTALLKANILDDVNSRNTVKLTDFSKISEAQSLIYFKKHPNIEGEVTTLMCDAVADPTDTSQPFKCRKPQLCKSDRFFGAKMPEMTHTFDGDTTVEFDRNLRTGNFPAAPAEDPRAPKAQ